jgi:acyl-CoA thioester hydrolase
MVEAHDPFEMPIRVEESDIDGLGHVNNVSYVRWVQNVAAAHWMALAPPEEQAKLLWVVLRHEIDYKRPAYLGDEIVARTWVGAATRIRFDRHSEILLARDRTVLARALTVWCPLDSVTRRPTVVSAELRSRFSVPV